MPLLIFLLAYFIRRRLDSTGHWNVDPFFKSVFDRVAPGSESENVTPGLVLVGGTALMLIVLDWSVLAQGWSVLGYPIDFILLVLLMGTPGWTNLIRVYSEAWHRGDMQAAWHHVKDQLPASERGQAGSPDAMHLSFSAQLLSVVFERYFLIVFWYVIGGIGLALFARGVVALRDLWPQTAMRYRFALLAEIMAWLPVRLLSLSFGLAGDFSGWLKEGRRYLMTPSMNAHAVLLAAANSSLSGYALDPKRFASVHPDDWADFGRRSLRAIRDLLNRSMLVWVCFLALFVISGLL